MELSNWVTQISQTREELGGMSVCPFAKNSRLSIVNTDGSDINPPPWDFDLIVYRLPDNYSIEELTDISKEYNMLYPEMIFLPDHKDRETFINGVRTNNGKYNLILCQWRDNLEIARQKLSKTSYYSFWDEEYLKEILSI
jgi:hypothetical protein